MKKLFGFLMVLVICVAAIGFYRGWFTVSSSGPDADSQKVNINLAVDPDKVKADAELVKEKAVDLTGQAKEDKRDIVDPPNDGVNESDQ